MNCLFLDLVKMIGIGQHDRTSHISLRKCHAHICFIIRNLHLFHQIFFDQLIFDISQLQHYTSGTNRGKKNLRILCQKQDHRISRRLLDRLQQRILRLYTHHICIWYNIDLIFAAVWLDHNIIVDLLSDVINTDRIWFFVCHPDNIRLIIRCCLFAGLALSACVSVFIPVLTLQAHSEQICQKSFSGTFFPIQNICMGNFICFYCIFDILYNIFMSNYIFKTAHIITCCLFLNFLWLLFQYSIILM